MIHQIKSSCSLTMAALVVVCASVCAAQVKEVHGGWGEHLGPQPRSAPSPTIHWEVQSHLASDHAGWQQFLVEHPKWMGLFDERTGQLWRAFGPGFRVCEVGPSHAVLKSTARNFAAELLPLLRMNPEEFHLKSIQETSRFFAVDLTQHHGAFRVDDARLTLRIDHHGRLVMWGGRFIETDHLPLVPSMTPHQAEAAARAHLRAKGFRFEAPEVALLDVAPFIHVREDKLVLEPRPAFKVRFHAENPAADWVVFVDSERGTLLEYWNDIRECGVCGTACHGDHEHPDGDDKKKTVQADALDPLEALLFLASVSGLVQSETHEGLLPSQTPLVTPQRDIYLTLGGVTVTTDATGGYVFSGGGSTVAVSSSLDGPFVTAFNSAGSNAAFSGTTGSGTYNVLFNNANSTIGERDLVHFANKAHATLKLRAPTQTQLDFPIIGNANLSSGSCNAFYSPSVHSINFYNAAGGCINTATSSTVVEHEYGHGITTHIYSSVGMNVPGYMGEGLSDAIAAACEDTSIIGQGFSSGGGSIRNLNNTCQYPSSCGAQIHSRGLVIGGSFWSTRQAFASAMGPAGKDLCDQYLFQHFVGAPQNEIESALEFLLLDDNDADLTNGTPNLLLIYQGFETSHGVPFPLSLVNISVPVHADSRDQLSPYEIRAQVTSVVGTAVTSAFLSWRAGPSGFFSTSAMTSLGGGWFTGTIPNQASSGNTVEYYVTSNVGGVIGTSPEATGTYHRIRTAATAAFFSDGFETPSGWVSAQLSTQNDWQNIVHGNPSHQYDPPAAFEGSLTWGNDLVPASNWNGDYTNNVNNTLTSPAIDCTGKTGITLRYRRWLTVEDATYDQARILVSTNGGVSYSQIWQNAVGSGSQHHIDTQWIDHAVALPSAADNNPNVRLRFQLISDAGLTFGGWNIDDLSLESNNTSITPVLTSSGTGQQGTFYSIVVNGDPSDVYALGLSTSIAPTWLEGVGTLSIDPLAANSFLLVPYGILPAGGSQSATAALDPGLLGTTLNFQALLLKNGSILNMVISNVESVTITP